MSSRVGIVVPTLGKREDYLAQCLASIAKAGSGESAPFVILVAPSSYDASALLKAGLVHKLVDDPGSGLAGAINLGFEMMPEEIEYINWLGDDDLLAFKSLELTTNFLDRNKSAVMVFGGCDYIDPDGRILWKNRSNQLAVPLMRVGPDLVPQPGALFQKEAFLNVGGLNTNFSWAFDFDLFIKLSKIGKVRYVDETLASFRWHPESLSVEFRSKSVAEASQVRVSHLPTWLRIFSPLWEYPVKWATLVAGNRVTIKAKKAIA